MMPKKNKGRQKIKMARMEKESNLQVTFCKRRSGLFKKASELCILCGVEIALVIFFSPGKGVFSFGHPSVERIVDRFLMRNQEPNSSNSRLIDAHRNANIYNSNMELTDVISRLEIEKKNSEELTKIKKEGRDNNWWEVPIESQGIEDLERLKIAMGCLKRDIDEQKTRMCTVPVSGDYNQVMGSGFEITMTPHGFMQGYGHFSG